MISSTIFTSSWFNSHNSLLLFSFYDEKTEAQRGEVNIREIINWDSNPGHRPPTPPRGWGKTHLPLGDAAEQFSLAQEKPLAGQLSLLLHMALALQLLELQVLKELCLCLQSLCLLERQ